MKENKEKIYFSNTKRKNRILGRSYPIKYQELIITY